MIDVQAIKWKAGKDWSPDELEAVFGEECKPGKLERWVGLAKAYTKDEEAAKDAVQQALIKTAAKINDYDPTKYHGKKCPFENWLGQRVVWEAKTASRKAKQQEKMSEAVRRTQADTGKKKSVGGGSRTENEIELHPSAFPALSEEFEWEEVSQFVARLEPDLAEAVELCAKQSCSHDEAARKSKWPCNVSAMKVRLCRARYKLRKWRREMGYEP